MCNSPVHKLHGQGVLLNNGRLPAHGARSVERYSRVEPASSRLLLRPLTRGLRGRGGDGLASNTGNKTLCAATGFSPQERNLGSGRKLHRCSRFRVGGMRNTCERQPAVLQQESTLVSTSSLRDGSMMKGQAFTSTTQHHTHKHTTKQREGGEKGRGEGG